MLELLLLLIGAHFVADYPLQGDFLARAKNRSNPVPGVPWYQALGAHASIHGLAVGLITGYWWLGVLETIAHACIDDAKCTGKIDFNADQYMHFMCKVVWVFAAVYVSMQ